MSVRKIETRYGIESYVNTACNIVLKQETPYDGESMIIIHRDLVPQLIENLQTLYQESADCIPEFDEDESEDD
jgi:hypothetical protein